MNKDLLIQIGIFIIVLYLLIGIIILILSQMQTQMWDYYNNKCSKLNGTIVEYECYRSPLNSYCDLSTTKVGTYCVLSDGTEIDLTIRNIKN